MYFYKLAYRMALKGAKQKRDFLDSARRRLQYENSQLLAKLYERKEVGYAYFETKTGPREIRTLFEFELTSILFAENKKYVNEDKNMTKNKEKKTVGEVVTKLQIL